MISKIEKVEKEQVTAYTCDCCKKEIHSNDFLEFQEMIHIDTEAGFGSVFGDGSKIKLDICQDCLKVRLGDILQIGTGAVPCLPYLTAVPMLDEDDEDIRGTGECLMCGERTVGDFSCTECSEMQYDREYVYDEKNEVLWDENREEVVCKCGNKKFTVHSVEKYCSHCQHIMEKED